MQRIGLEGEGHRDWFIPNTSLAIPPIRNTAGHDARAVGGSRPADTKYRSIHDRWSRALVALRVHELVPLAQTPIEQRVDGGSRAGRRFSERHGRVVRDRMAVSANGVEHCVRR